MAATASIPEVYFRVAEAHGLRGVDRLLQVTLPAIMPEVITTLRVTAGLCWMVVVAAEMIAGRDGLGFAVDGLAERDCVFSPTCWWRR